MPDANITLTCRFDLPLAIRFRIFITASGRNVSPPQASSSLSDLSSLFPPPLHPPSVGRTFDCAIFGFTCGLDGDADSYFRDFGGNASNIKEASDN